MVLGIRVGHPTLGSGFESAKLDSWVRAQQPNKKLRHSDPAYMFMRGREQAIIDGLGGSFSSDNVKNDGKGITMSGNSINGIADNPLKGKTWREGCMLLAKLYPVKPTIDWDGAMIWCR